MSPDHNFIFKHAELYRNDETDLITSSFSQAVCDIAVNLVFLTFLLLTNIIYCCYFATMAFDGDIRYKMETAWYLLYLRLATLVRGHSVSIGYFQNIAVAQKMMMITALSYCHITCSPLFFAIFSAFF